MHQFHLVLDIIKLNTEKHLLVSHLLRNQSLGCLLTLDKPNHLILCQIYLDCRELAIHYSRTTLSRISLLPNIPTIWVVSNRTLWFVSIRYPETLTRADTDHDISVASLYLSQFELVSLALSKRNIPYEGVPNAIVVFLDNYDALLAAVYAEIMPVRIIKEVVKLEYAKFFMEFLERFSQNSYLLSLELALFDYVIHLEIFLLVLKRQLFSLSLHL